MDKERYRKIVESILVIDTIPVHRAIIENYELASAKTTTSIVLMQLKRYEEALDVLLTIKKEDFAQEDEFEIEEWANVLYLIGLCYAKAYSDYEKALYYSKESLKIMEEKGVGGILFQKGEIWVFILDKLEKLGRNEERQKEIDNKLIGFNKEERLFRNNSYIFNLYYNLANIEIDIHKAIEYMYTAVDSFPLEERGKIELSTLYKNKDKEPLSVFKEMEELTHCTVAWDI